MTNKILLPFIPVGMVAFTLICTSVHAQITPDNTLSSESSIVQPNVNINGLSSDRIDGGAVRDSTLFHSFQEFNVSEGRGAYFTNLAEVENVISRVTGENTSNILGRLGVIRGNANLFLINPNGIIFGANASLDLNGSFLASTSDSVELSDGLQFSATNPQNVPLLTISAPIGLGFSSNPGPINVQGTGHTLFLPFGLAGSPIIGSGGSSTGLKTKPGKTIALLGGDVNFDGGVLTATSGRIEVGSVNSGLVNLTSNLDGIFFRFDAVSSFKDINFDKQALLDASGFFNGDIFLQAKNINLTNGSFILISNFGDFPSGQIKVNITDSLVIAETINSSTTNPNLERLAAGIGTQNFSAGKGADVFVSTQQLVIQGAFGIATETFGSGSGGNIELAVDEELTRNYGNTVSEVFLTPGLIATFASSTTSSTANAGNITLTTDRLTIGDGATFASETFGAGNGGEVTINASKSVTVSGGLQLPFNSFLPSFLGTLTTSLGKAGDVTINTSKLRVEDGEVLGASTVAFGTAGNLDINAIDSIDVIGKVPGSSTPAQITSSAIVIDPALNLFYGLAGNLSGESRIVTVKTNTLNIQNGGQISARNDGTRGAGTLDIKANSINLENEGAITVTAASGVGGNILLKGVTAI